MQIPRKKRKKYESFSLSRLRLDRLPLRDHTQSRFPPAARSENSFQFGKTRKCTRLGTVPFFGFFSLSSFSQQKSGTRTNVLRVKHQRRRRMTRPPVDLCRRRDDLFRRATRFGKASSLPLAFMCYVWTRGKGVSLYRIGSTFSSLKYTQKVTPFFQHELKRRSTTIDNDILPWRDDENDTAATTRGRRRRGRDGYLWF